MTKLTQKERALLERHYDGDLDASGEARAEELLESSSAARVFVSALEEITTATKVAEEAAWEAADPPDVTSIVDVAANASEMSDAPLDELAPMLERFHDGETIAAEDALVHALLAERDDVADYLASIEELGVGVRASTDMIAEDVDFGGFWDQVSDRIEAADTDFDREEHQVLLYRYHDGEVTDSERTQVEAWIEAGDDYVIDTLEALQEIEVSVTAGIDFAQEDVELGAIWAGVQETLDDEIEGQGDNVVSIHREKRDRESRFSGWSQGAIGAVAAVLCITLIGALFHEQLFKPDEKVIVKEKIVIVDSVEYEPGSSVMVNSPMQQASMVTKPAEEGEEKETEQPTVIWLFDSGQDGGGDAAEDVAPGDGAQPEGDVQEKKKRDTGVTGGQPI